MSAQVVGAECMCFAVSRVQSLGVVKVAMDVVVANLKALDVIA